ncbi:Contactin-3 Brain-derived immunoglobulin superfamily protein 1 [Collichthys lucidus]|nr:Contactin-3 Brain-derived immunoglobulin superfamily protein 1 [Collichthys lucidus]
MLQSVSACTEDVIFQGPRWRTEPSDLILPINSPDQQATIMCEAEGSPTPQYRWSLNGTLIDLGNDYRRHMSGGSLIISNLDKDQDTGVYQCTAFNMWGSVLSRRASLQFAYLDNIKTQTVRSAVNVREGQGVVLLCGPPAHSGELTFAWIFNEYPYFVQQDSRRFISQETGSLYIAKVEPSDVGNYTCVVNNTVTKEKVLSSPTPLVLRSDAKPHWLQTMTDTALSIEENLFWECKANGKPKPSYSWLKNGDQVMAEGRVQIENGALSIAALNLSDSGMYQCVAENKHGIIYSSAQLMVLASPPSFSKSPLRALLKARSGSEVTLECKPQASPPAISLWKKGNEILQRTERITLLPNGTLKIANVTRRDAASYTCIAKNQFGTASTTGRLLITEPTRITMRPTNMEIIVGESIVLPCQIACDPALDVSFSWAFNGQLIDFQRDSDHFERVGGTISGDLMIRNIQLNHGGKYVCVIDTDVESLSTSAILVVKGPPGPPDKVAVEEITDSTAQLSWTPGRDNGSPITGYIIQARTPFTVGWQAVDTVPEVVNGNMLTATVVGLNAWVEYEFRVVARNNVGLGEPSPASTKTRTEDTIPDTAPTDVGGGGGTKSELVITWEPVPEEMQNGEGFGYIIAFRPVGTVTWTRAVISTPGVARYVFRNDTIPPFSPFDVKVGAYNNRGEGPFSSIGTVYSAEEVPSVAPKRVRTRSVSAVQIEVIWEALPTVPERVLGYEVVYWEDDTKPDTIGKVRISGNYTLVNITGLKANTVYYLSVAAFNTAGPGPQSAPINTTTKKPPPDRAPLNIQWTMIGSTLTLHWDPVVAMETESKVTGYLVLLKRHRYNDITTILTNKTAVELSLSSNDNYLIQIKAMSEGGEGVGSEPIHIHKLSEFPVVFPSAYRFRSERMKLEHGSAGFGSDPPQPIVPLCSPHQCTALLRLVMSNQSPRSNLPSPYISSVSPSYVNPLLDWHEAWASVAGLGKTGMDWTLPNS